MKTRSIANDLYINLIKRLAVLKIWVDANGVHGGNSYWKQGHESYPFDPSRWLRKRDIDEYDINDIGALAIPSPSFDEVSTVITNAFSFMLALEEDEKILTKNIESNRPLALQMLRPLPGGRLLDIGLY